MSNTNFQRLQRMQNAAARNFAKLHDTNITQLTFLSISIGYRCVESTTRLPSSVRLTKPSDCNSLRILLVYSSHIDSCVSSGHLRQTYCQHSLHRQTLLLVGSHAAPLPFGTVFLHLYASLTVSLVLGLSSRLTCSRKTFVAGPVSAPPVSLPGLL